MMMLLGQEVVLVATGGDNSMQWETMGDNGRRPREVDGRNGGPAALLISAGDWQ